MKKNILIGIALAVALVLAFASLRIAVHGDDAFGASPIGEDGDTVVLAQWSTFAQNVSAYDADLTAIVDDLNEVKDRGSQELYVARGLSATLTEWNRQVAAVSPPECAGDAEFLYLDYLLYNAALYGAALNNLSQFDGYIEIGTIVDWQDFAFERYREAFNEAERNCT